MPIIKRFPSIYKFIREELQASEEYVMFGQMLENLGRPDLAKLAYQIASDEAMHKEVLKDIEREIRRMIIKENKAKYRRRR